MRDSSLDRQQLPSQLMEQYSNNKKYMKNNNKNSAQNEGSFKSKHDSQEYIESTYSKTSNIINNHG